MTPTAAEEATPAAAPAASAPATAGAALRRAREARGLHIAALAATLKVPQSKLEALEADRYKDLPDATFARALARSMCRVLKVDAAPVLAMLPSSGAEASLDRVTPGLNQPFRERSSSQEPMLSTELLKRPVVLGVVALLVAAVAVYAVPSSWIEQVTQRFQRSEEPAAASTTAPAGVSGVADAGTADAPITVDAPPASASDVTAGQAAAGVPSTTPTAVATPSATTPNATPATTAPATTAATGVPVTPASSAAVAPLPGSSPLLVKASAESWVEVVDAKGSVLLSRLLRPGDQVDVSGIAPLKLRVGNVAGTALVFRGQPVDLAARSRDNVARLELN